MNKFKVGDWVRVTLVHNKSHSFIVKYSNIWNQPEYYTKELWKPKQGEWCWFWTNMGKTMIGKFISYNDEKKLYYYDNPFYNTNNQMCGVDRFQATHCEPFIGNLPSFLQD